MSVPVKRYQRRKNITDPTSDLLYYLKQEPGSSQVKTIQQLAEEIETIGGMSAEDVTHVMKAFFRRLRAVLTDGNRVKIDGLGTFLITFNTEGAKEEKDCTVRNIRKVNVRFIADKALRLVNDSNAATRGGNNVRFYIKADQTTAQGGGTTPGGEEDDDDPTA